MSNIRMATSVEEIYGNYSILSPTGELLCYCRRKKIDWYLNRNLAEQVTPNSIKLKFIPKGRGNQGDPCLLQEFENKCVVCGTIKDLTRHHIVPYCYRRYMSKYFEHMTHFDILPLCIVCHDTYEKFANQLKAELLIRHNVKVTKKILDTEFLKCLKMVWALDNYKLKIPSARLQEMQLYIQKYLKTTNQTLKEFKKLAEDKNPCLHQEESGAKEIVEKSNLDDLAVEWRNHFLKYADPKYLPGNWRPEERNASGHII